MRIPQQVPGIFYALTMCCSVGGGLSPFVAHAGGSSAAESTVVEVTPVPRFQGGPCGIRSLRSRSGQGGDVNPVGIWHCAQRMLMPDRFRDTDSGSAASTKKNVLNWGVRVRHDQLQVSVGLKW
jgi:hypothetical protein